MAGPGRPRKEDTVEQPVNYTHTAIGTVIMPNGMSFFVEIPYNFETGQVGELKKLAKPNHGESIEEFKLAAVKYSMV